MKGLFVHDLRSYNFNGIEYTTNFSYDIIKERYLSHFDELRIINRTKKIQQLVHGKYVISNGPGVIFVDEIDMFSGVDFFVKQSIYKRVIDREVRNADFVIVRLDSFLGLIALKYCRKYCKKYLIEVAGCVWDSFWNKGVFGKFLAPFLFRDMKKEIRIAPNVVYVTTSFLQKRYPTNGNTISCSNVMLDNCDYDKVLEQRLEFIKQKAEKKCIDIVTIAAIDVPYKNQEAVIKALGILKLKERSGFKYTLIGGGESDYLRKVANNLGVEDQVIFMGSISHGRIFDILDDTDIYIQPSKQEGLPRSLIEAMSRGCVCYGSRVAGIPELLLPESIFDIKKAPQQIAEKLLNYSIALACEQAKRNIDEARMYSRDLLEERRYHFFERAINDNSVKIELKELHRNSF